MQVNPFAFGVVATLAALFILTVVHAWISALRDDDGEEYELDEEEFQLILQKMTGKKFRVVRKNGYLVGEPIEEPDDDKTD